MSHTLGPWNADGSSIPYKYREGERYYEIVAPTPAGLSTNGFNYSVADTSNRHHGISPEEDAANARLIAAAPELLGALKALYDLTEGDSRGTEYSQEPLEIIAKAREAISKAEGC